MSLSAARNDDQRFEKFPVERRRIKLSSLLTMIFFDPEEAEPDEADFVLVDDLFKMEGTQSSTEPGINFQKAIPNAGPLIGPVVFTLIPRYCYQYITAPLSRRIRRALILTAKRYSLEINTTRVRPVFVQWEVEIPNGFDAVHLMQLFQKDLDAELHENSVWRRQDFENASFWSDNCLIQRAEDVPDQKQLIRFVNNNQILRNCD